jgi:hypothetical protein
MRYTAYNFSSLDSLLALYNALIRSKARIDYGIILNLLTGIKFKVYEANLQICVIIISSDLYFT